MITKIGHSVLTCGASLFRFDRGSSLLKMASVDEPLARYIDSIKPEKGTYWLLVHALGAGEYYDSNRNGDIFYEKSLNNFPDSWTGDPDIDRVIARNVWYGAPTFYGGSVYLNHKNKDPDKSAGTIEYVHWNDSMKRVELVIKIYRDRAESTGGSWVLRKLDNGDLVDVSMGSKVPYDLCEPVYDKKAYQEALSTYDPSIHRNPAHAVLMYHKATPIYGLSVTRSDYIDLAKFHINKVYPDGRKVMLDNPYPRFFDISFVFIGAEPPAKVLLKLSKCQIDGIKCGSCRAGKCDLYIPNGATMAMFEKTAGLQNKSAAKKVAKDKKSTITKATPSTFSPKTTGKLQQNYPDLDENIVESLASKPIEHSLSTTGLSGIILKPHEFQRIVLIRIGKRDLADKLEDEGKVFAPTDEIADMPPISHYDFMPHIFSLFRDMLPFRSVFAPFHHAPIRIRRVVISVCRPRQRVKDELLDKISAAYNGYRKRLFEVIEKEASLAISQNSTLRGELVKFGKVFVTPEVLEIFRTF